MADIALFTTSEVADRLRVDSSTIRKWVAKGLLKAVTLPGGHHRFRPEDVEALLADASKAVAS
ncbi:MerR family transcriptional regulator [Mycobacteroides abscessus]|uniref:MerR family transcriptional regulator n=1 Tax=Mycobacteroides abscessus TaxID=36809 RepID=UPI00092C9B3C|nr:helix-turn-helix domain-containing protein [Mycobacteroides abscessus]QST89596.1 DNA binding protein [Mycobacterium phage prophi62-3]QST89938.1 DNA binding protein [Mycobacterium phage prophi108-1]MBN7454273.1 helix-turn-helix domain-containing protein [Mycobacteroides abscessus subsp. abscessus]MBN7542384.1 helix-turn-helix domain-containing protein [Mycobacteroides abscessus subsp. abscessus]MBN7569933.1 helix-turn-helix domain-containing protein [Mycobacteroides abscessus subsp. abscessu